jgi:hypothetical protein
VRQVFPASRLLAALVEGRSMKDYRAELLEWAKGEVGPGRRADYWRAVFPNDPGPQLAWCGVFCLAGLHHVGLTNAHWKLGVGFVGPLKLPQTRTPSRGDIGYLHSPYQHHFLFDYEYDGKVHSVDGNQPDVREKVRPKQGIVFYSIQPLIDAVVEPEERTTQPDLEEVIRPVDGMNAPLPEAGFLRGQKYSVPGIQDKGDK